MWDCECLWLGATQPPTGRREAWVTRHRTSLDYGQALLRISQAFPDAEKIVLVQDNLSTHTLSALYLVLPPEHARGVARRFEVHFTPRHGSWLNMQELEFSALAVQALRERVGDQQQLERVVERWVTARKKRAKPIRWHFTTMDARLKLTRLYPYLMD